MIDLKKSGERNFSVFVKETQVGYISYSLKGNSAEVYFLIEEEYRGNHYATESLYAVTPVIHETYPVIFAVISKDNEIARHVVEHCGYQLTDENETFLCYVHREYHSVKDDDYHPEGEVLYLAGGCFWGMEKALKTLVGVTETKCGYANGHTKDPTYEDVCRLNTGYKETVRVTFDPKIVSIENVLRAYLLCVDPEQENGQGYDIGEQYTLGVYWKNNDLKERITEFLAKAKELYHSFHVEYKPLEVFYEAEEYHQDYLGKNPNGYCHISFHEMSLIAKLNEMIMNEEKV